MIKNNFIQKNIPEGWNSIRVGDLGFVYSGLRSKSKTDFGQGAPFITYMNVFKNSKIDINKFDLVKVEDGENQNKVMYGDIFFTVSSETPEEVGMSSVLLDKIDSYYLNSFCFGFRLKNLNDLLPQYARYLFRGQDFRSKIHKMAQGSTRFNLSKERVLSLDIVLPPLTEQKKIAEILETVDDDITKTQKVIDTTEKLKRGLMQQLFTRGIGHTKFKQTKVGEIPEEWEIVLLGDVTEFIDYRGKTPRKVESGIPLVTAKNVRQGYISVEPREYIAESDYHGWMTRGIPKIGDVLFTTEAPLGFVAQINTDQKIALAQRVITIQSNIFNLTYLKYMLMSPSMHAEIQALGTGGTVKGIKSKTLKKLEILQPSKEEQEKISEILSAIDEKILVNKKLKEKLSLLKKGLMQDLLSGKVRVPHWWYSRCLDVSEFRDYYFDILKNDQEYFEDDFDAQARIDPFSMFYERYVFKNLKGVFTLEKRKSAGPDFVSKLDKVAFECWVPAVADNYSIVKTEPVEISHAVTGQISSFKPWSQVNDDIKKLRYTTALKDKICQFQSLKQDSFSFVVCINGAKLEAGEKRDGSSVQNDVQHSTNFRDLGTTLDPMGQLLYGKQESFTRDGNKLTQEIVDKKDIRKNGKKVNDIHGIFRRHEYSKISAIIFTPYDGVRMDKEGKKSYLYLNPNAQNKLTHDIIEKLKNFCKTL